MLERRGQWNIPAGSFGEITVFGVETTVATVPVLSLWQLFLTLSWKER